MRLFVHLFLLLSLAACKKSSPAQGGGVGPDGPGSAAVGSVTGMVTDSKGNTLSGIKVTVEHTVWAASYVFASTDNAGRYKIDLPGEPAGSWTAKAQLESSAYGKQYKFDLAADHTDAFTRQQSTVRNFTWRLSGQRADGGFYGAHVDIYQMGTDVDPSQVKLVFTPAESTLIDGTAAVVIERQVHDVAGTFMVTDVPIGKYTVKAVYPGRTLLLDNRHEDDSPSVSQPVVFGKYGYLGETEYNIEFWLSD
ncbi:carboxypeptidase-like regulatory domain-containing protein [Puia sp. P3]|uniref:carboxypeptidase-like regulatory domain-containing protein n=1 Tax=Puia sp. P3 TaxID=3423952 RepID=UPI003D67BFFA